MSDSLRDALEKLRDEWLECSEPAGENLADLLAAHPVEPAPGVSDEIAKIAYSAFWKARKDQNGVARLERTGAHEWMRAALEAAQPYMAATPVVSRERVAEALIDVAFRGDAERLTNGSRVRIADALLAAGVFREPPTREQIAEAQHDFHTDHAWRDPASCRDWCTPVYLRMADAVLALIGGDGK